jgi:hypothetical protein
MLIELIRKQIRTCGQSRYRISKDTGIEAAALCRLMQGKTCTVETVDILLKYFGFKVIKKTSKKGGTK